MKMFDFPVWVFVNLRMRAQERFPYYILIKGGPPTPLPATLAVFSTREAAMECDPKEPFVVKEVDVDAFQEILNKGKGRETENVIFDMATPNAVQYRVEQLLARLESGSRD